VRGYSANSNGVIGVSGSSYAGCFKGRCPRRRDVPEISAPRSPDASVARIFAQDAGGSKTKLSVKFPGGAVQHIAIEP